MPLTEQMKADGWIEHEGGPCPIDGAAIVSARFRGGSGTVSRASVIWWGRTEHPNGFDIIAYRPEQPQ